MGLVLSQERAKQWEITNRGTPLVGGDQEGFKHLPASLDFNKLSFSSSDQT
jgi:hypothetical protein